MGAPATNTASLALGNDMPALAQNGVADAGPVGGPTAHEGLHPEADDTKGDVQQATCTAVGKPPFAR